MTYTKAGFKTKREALGLTPKFLAERIGCHHNIVWRIESPTNPASVSPAAARVLDDLATDYDMAAELHAVKAKRAGVAFRPATREQFDELVPALADWPERAVGMFVAEVARRAGVPIEYSGGVAA